VLWFGVLWCGVLLCGVLWCGAKWCEVIVAVVRLWPSLGIQPQRHQPGGQRVGCLRGLAGLVSGGGYFEFFEFFKLFQFFKIYWASKLVEFLRASTKYFKIASKKTTLRPQKVMLLVGRSSKNTYVRHHTKLMFLEDVLAKSITF